MFVRDLGMILKVITDCEVGDFNVTKFNQVAGKDPLGFLDALAVYVGPIFASQIPQNETLLVPGENRVAARDAHAREGNPFILYVPAK